MNSEHLIGVSDAFSAFVYRYPSSCPRAHCTPNKSVPTLCYIRTPGPVYTGHACRHLPSAVPWISEDCLLRQQCSWLLKQINKSLWTKWQKMCVGQSVAQSKNTRSWKPEFNRVEHGYQMDGRPLHGDGDSSVVRTPDSWLKGHGFESLQEQRENFPLQGQLSVLTLILISVPPLCYCSST